MPRTAQEIINSKTQLATIREPYEYLKQTCTELAYRERSPAWELVGRGNTGQGGGSNFGDKGRARGQAVFDPTANASLEIWGNGIIGNYAPKSIKWFQEQLPSVELMKSKVVRQWLQDTDDHLRFVINRSNYHEQKLVAIKDAGAIGDSYIYIDEDIESGKIITQTPHPRQFYIRRDFFGRPVEVMDCFRKTRQQVRDEYGDNALSPDQLLSLETESGRATEVNVIHVTDRNPDFDPERVGNAFMKWRTFYVNVEAKQIMQSGGYRTLNPIPWNLNRPSHEDYGRGVISQILIEILTANFMSRDMLNVSQQAAQPAMLMTSALKHKLSLAPGAVTFIGNKEFQGGKLGDLVARLVDTTGYPFGVDQHQRWQAAIENRLGVPLFLAMNRDDGTYKNIADIRQRQAERIVLLAPFLWTLGTVTDMELDRIYSIELEAGRAPDPPLEVLEGLERDKPIHIDIQYIGPLLQLLQQHFETGNLLNTIANIHAAASVDQESLKVVDGDELMRKILISGDAPEEIVLTPDDVADLRAFEAQQQEAILTAQMAAEAAKASPGLAKAPESGSPLEAVMGAA